MVLNYGVHISALLVVHVCREKLSTTCEKRGDQGTSPTWAFIFVRDKSVQNLDTNICCRWVVIVCAPVLSVMAEIAQHPPLPTWVYFRHAIDLPRFSLKKRRLFCRI